MTNKTEQEREALVKEWLALEYQNLQKLSKEELLEEIWQTVRDSHKHYDEEELVERIRQLKA